MADTQVMKRKSTNKKKKKKRTRQSVQDGMKNRAQIDLNLQALETGACRICYIREGKTKNIPTSEDERTHHHLIHLSSVEKVSRTENDNTKRYKKTTWLYNRLSYHKQFIHI